MKLKIIFSTLIFALLIWFLSSLVCYAEIFYLKNGEVVRGSIHEENEETYKIIDGSVTDKGNFELYFNTYYLKKNEVKKIEAPRKNSYGHEPIDIKSQEEVESLLEKVIEDLPPIKKEIVDRENNVKVYKQYYSNGTLWIEVPIINGKREGVARHYYSDGNLKSEIPYKGGKKEGILKEYYKNGHLWYEITYRNDIKNGTHRVYTEDGLLKSETYWNNDRQEGISR